MTASNGVRDARRNENRNGNGHSPEAPPIVGESPAFLRAVAIARKFARSGLSAVVVGETGTGKEVLARNIHRWSGRPGRFMGINCGALPSELIERELFGHRRGAYTGAVSDGRGLISASDDGTLFLDELPSLSLAGQARFLRVLDERLVRPIGDVESEPVDLRVISATQADPRRLAADGLIRPDLGHRLFGVIISIPPLRERGEDILSLAMALAGHLGVRLERGCLGLLRGHSWPGNVRELRTAIERAVVLSESGPITPLVLAESLDLGASPVGEEWTRERKALLDLARRSGGGVARMADEVGVSRSAMYRRLKKYGIRLEG